MGRAVCPWCLSPGSACGWTRAQVMECFVCCPWGGDRVTQCIPPVQALLETVVKTCWASTETLQSSRNCFSAAPFLMSRLSILLKTGCADSGVGMLEFLWERRIQREPVPARGLIPQLLWGWHCWSTAGEPSPEWSWAPWCQCSSSYQQFRVCPDTAVTQGKAAQGAGEWRGSRLLASARLLDALNSSVLLMLDTSRNVKSTSVQAKSSFIAVITCLVWQMVLVTKELIGSH